jgi:hypothetical protein
VLLEYSCTINENENNINQKDGNKKDNDNGNKNYVRADSSTFPTSTRAIDAPTQKFDSQNRLTTMSCLHKFLRRFVLVQNLASEPLSWDFVLIPPKHVEIT